MEHKRSPALGLFSLSSRRHTAAPGATAWRELRAAQARAEALVPAIAAHLAVAELELEAIRRSVAVLPPRPTPPRRPL